MSGDCPTCGGPGGFRRLVRVLREQHEAKVALGLIGAIFEITEERITEDGEAMRVRVEAIEDGIASTTSVRLKVKRDIPVEVLTDPDAYTRVK